MKVSTQRLQSRRRHSEDATVAATIPPPPSDIISVMLPEIEAGHGLGMGAAARILHVDPSCTFRMATKGTKTPDGRVVKLEAIRVGVKWTTSRPAIERYLRRLANSTAMPAAMSKPSHKKRNLSAEKLAAMGC
jgi:hypothetical protein